MIDALRVFEELSKSLDESTARFLSETLARMYEELAGALTKSDLREFEARIDARLAESAEAQAGTAAALKSLAQRIEELAEAQRATEARVQELAETQRATETRVQELAETQRVTETRVQELAEAQAGTAAALELLAQRVEELAEAQRSTEGRMEQLAEAQRATEARLQRLEEKFERMVDEFAGLRRQVGGLSDVVGYGLENSVFPYLRSFAQQEFGIELRRFDRRNIEYPDGRFDEINIYAEGRRNDEEVILLGEAKAQPSKRDVDAFAGRIDRVRGYLKRPVFSFFVGHSFSPEIERHIAEHHPEIKPVKSFVFEVSYAREVPGATPGAEQTG